MNNLDKFCLRWNDFETNIRESFKRLREEQNYFDVTLACDDDYQIQAHKIILSAGSPFFNDIFRKTEHPSPFIYFKGIKGVELEQVLDFLYNGEAYISQQELNKFLETAQELQVKGLQSNDEDESSQNRTVKTKSNVESNFTEMKGNLNPNLNPTQKESIFDSLEELADSFDNSDCALVTLGEENPGLNTNRDLDLQIEQMMEKNEGLWQCKMCGKTSKKLGNLKNHVETHIEGVTHTCHICNKTTSTRISLQMHISNIHSETFDCNNCGKSGMNKLAYRDHKRRTSCKTKFCKISSIKQV